MSGNREHNPDPLPQQAALTSKSEAATDAGGPKKADPDVDLLQKQLGDPPEKPLPGDCCGSGCVRCVWDIYFEDLDLYNSHTCNNFHG
ncbi:hypothetical protein L7F22_012144 [Adiantum nelumboides]|nr:hypothetical protein [Adiantum nelumboides]MCO5558559.1 hypothetical protein [Adiantum nelumboides]